MPSAAGAALLETFDRVRIVNLKSRADRRREMHGELARLGLTPEHGGTVAFHEACRPGDRGDFPSLGARGCFMSHLTLLQEAWDAGTKSLLILEDDLDFSGDVETRLPATLALLVDRPWSIFYGGYELYGGPLQQPLTRAAPDESVRTTHFIGFSREAIGIAVPYLRAMLARPAGDAAGGPMHVDGAYSWLRAGHPELETMLASPELGHQRPSRTDIDDGKLLDRIVGVRELAAVARQMKRRLVRKR